MAKSAAEPTAPRRDQQHFTKTGDGIGRIGLHRRDIVLDEGSVFVDFLSAGVRHYTSGIALEDLDASPEKVRLYEVIDGGPLEILADSKFVYSARIPASPHVLLASVIALLAKTRG